MPVRESLNLVLWQIAGIAFYNEDKYYTSGQLVMLGCIVSFLITGIFIISCKSDTVKDFEALPTECITPPESEAEIPSERDQKQKSVNKEVELQLTV